MIYYTVTVTKHEIPAPLGDDTIEKSRKIFFQEVEDPKIIDIIKAINGKYY